jgi:hypothetical protein
MSVVCSHWHTSSCRASSLEPCYPRRFFSGDQSAGYLMLWGQECRVVAATLSIENLLFPLFWDDIFLMIFLRSGRQWIPTAVLKYQELSVLAFIEFVPQNISDVLFLHDNARPHTSVCPAEATKNFGWTVLPHPPYRPDLAPSGFYLLGSLKMSARRPLRQGRDTAESRAPVVAEKKFCWTGIHAAVQSWEKNVDKGGDYIERRRTQQCCIKVPWTF